jgi:hypothetical protein
MSGLQKYSCSKIRNKKNSQNKIKKKQAGNNETFQSDFHSFDFLSFLSGLMRGAGRL